MLLIIGGRYLTFSTLYGKKFYWVLGATLGVFAYLLFSLHAQPFVTLLAGGSIELFLALFCTSVIVSLSMKTRQNNIEL